MRIANAIYLDHHASTPVDARVLSKMVPYFAEHFGNPHASEHAIGWRAAKALEQAYSRVGNLIGADPDEIVFTSGATEANNLAILGLVQGRKETARRKILVSAIEHKSILAIARAATKNLDLVVEQIPVDSEGFLDISALRGMLSEEVFLVSVMAVNNEVGSIQDLSEISALVRDSGALFHCDAAQAPCAMEMKTLADITDALSLSGHKIYGPAGVGALYISRSLQSVIQPVLHGGGQQLGLRGGTTPLPLCAGMGFAAELLSREGNEERERLATLRDKFVSRLRMLGHNIQENGPKDAAYRHAGNANIQFPEFVAQDILAAIQPHLAASTGSACTSGIPEPSHVLRAMGLSADEAEASIRFGLGRSTTEQDIEDAAKIIGEALERLKSSEVSYATAL